MGTGTAMTTPPTSTGYIHPEVLVDTEWVAQHLDDANVRIVEADEDPLLYDALGHIRNAVKLDWHVDVQDPVRRDFVNKADFETLMRRYGIANDTTVVFYGDKNNWYAAYSYWLFKLYGHGDARIMNGGRTKWEAEQREYTKDVPNFAPTTYTAKEPDLSLRAFRRQVEDVLEHGSAALVDVRSPDEYTGKLLHMINYPQEGAQRGGHIPGAQNIPWATAANSDGTFKSAEELRQIYGGKGIVPERDVIAYCRIGERSAHTWFVLTQLLGYPNVRNYDGSWTEWGNLVNAPIEKDV
ncbi:MAG: Thiosulfate sulfurtransferase, rhodanese [Ktedonobacterales bacterium]|jgi:thiosulfate/3-mercaptopyruvate sulfurtransferase|nr:MAG: Thiosulfate sulfurtransferase, rhodanese [Ktedonobacterales bacterium]